MISSALTKPVTVLTITHVHHNMTNVVPLHGAINILLGGGMMGSMLLVVVCICYCCHKRTNKPEYQESMEGEDARSERWMEDVADNDSTLQIFTLAECYEEEGLFSNGPTPKPSPPPSYHDVMALERREKSSDLPSYEEALKMTSETRECTIYMDQLTYI